MIEEAKPGPPSRLRKFWQDLRANPSRFGAVALSVFLILAAIVVSAFSKAGAFVLLLGSAIALWVVAILPEFVVYLGLVIGVGLSRHRHAGPGGGGFRQHVVDFDLCHPFDCVRAVGFRSGLSTRADAHPASAEGLVRARRGVPWLRPGIDADGAVEHGAHTLDPADRIGRRAIATLQGPQPGKRVSRTVGFHRRKPAALHLPEWLQLQLPGARPYSRSEPGPLRSRLLVHRRGAPGAVHRHRVAGQSLAHLAPGKDRSGVAPADRSATVAAWPVVRPGNRHGRRSSLRWSSASTLVRRSESRPASSGLRASWPPPWSGASTGNRCNRSTGIF